MQFVFGDLEGTLRGDYLLHPPPWNAPTSTPHMPSPSSCTQNAEHHFIHECTWSTWLFFLLFKKIFFPCPHSHSSYWIMHFCLRSPRERRGRRDTQGKGGDGIIFVMHQKKKSTLKQRHQDPRGSASSFHPQKQRCSPDTLVTTRL